MSRDQGADPPNRAGPVNGVFHRPAWSCSRPWLLELPGLGPISAAQVLVSWSHAGRLRSEAAFAALAAPIRSRRPRER